MSPATLDDAESVLPLVAAQPSALPDPTADLTEDAAARRRRLLDEAIQEGGLPTRAALDDTDEDDGLPADGHVHANDDERDACSYNYTYFHVVFILACMYVSMLLSQWNTVSGETGELISVGHDWTSVWVKVVSGWVAFGLYAWTLVAPILLPNRQW